MMKALLVEDDPEVAEALTDGLRQHGWDVAHVATGTAALTAPVACDIVLLDLNLPDMDGLEVCQQLRVRVPVPIIAVTARSDEFNKVLCLRLGADDYVVKPYRLQELLARMTAVLRRPQPPVGREVEPPKEPESQDDRVITRAAMSIDLWRREVDVAGRAVPLTRKEFELLTLLARSPGRVFSRQYLLENVWGQQWMSTSRTLDSHISALRRKLGNSQWIRTVRGVGFSFETLTGPQDPPPCA
ncbi:DNA-binding response OmpR family regulator [Streptomyces sp. V4I23]|uniref:response regulator transcription factor n=1 Tax=Streptomyces sp. V4I23 TaxID=3042282 RepID=UPI00277FF986|nr:response regulator transcription factor [Streptomyces sp. V4I23]MDQ1007710.1 DNA-binding response OmpR family regulator [Streptomyces sp. V4I23]